MANQTTYWGILSTPNAPIGSIPFVATDNVSIATNVLNFMINNWQGAGTLSSSGNAVSLNLNCGGDFTGTDAINTYNQIDSFQLNAAITGSNVGFLTNQFGPGHTVSSSQGTAVAPAANLSGDYLGCFSAWGYSGQGLAASVYGWYPMAGIYAKAVGATAGNVGGELHFATKIDGGAITDRCYLDNSGNLRPTTVVAGTSSSAGLGAANSGWSRLTLNFAIAGGTGPQTYNMPCGQVQIAGSTASLVVTNSLVTANTLVMCQVATVDATAVIGSVVSAAGHFTINMSANATGTTKINFLVVNTDS